MTDRDKEARVARQLGWRKFQQNQYDRSNPPSAPAATRASSHCHGVEGTPFGTRSRTDRRIGMQARVTTIVEVQRAAKCRHNRSICDTLARFAVTGGRMAVAGIRGATVIALVDDGCRTQCGRNCCGRTTEGAVDQRERWGVGSSVEPSFCCS